MTENQYPQANIPQRSAASVAETSASERKLTTKEKQRETLTINK